jgi:ubiquinone/menaquinone biosynthesis C-methylase UbiE
VKEYYDLRATEYDDWWLTAARERDGWQEELEDVLQDVARLPPARTLDVACGTGFLTRHLPGEVVGLDQSGRMLAVARDRARAG